MHETLSENFIGYIDNNYVENGNLRVSGWLVPKVNKDHVTLILNIGRDLIFYNFNERQDVATFYSTNDANYLNSGFDISIPLPKVDNFNIEASINGKKETIFSLSSSENRMLVNPSHAEETFDIKINSRVIPELVVVDNFYDEPDKVRQIALEQSFNPDLRYHKGQRTEKKFIAQGTKQVFESLLGRKIINWVDYAYNGIFQFCTAEDPLVYHSDMQRYAGAVYLTPNAPITTGTSFYRSKKFPEIRKCHSSDTMYNQVFENNYYDKTRFELVDIVGNVYNRLVLWDASLIHSASEYFGSNKENSRLFHLFFFDIEE